MKRLILALALFGAGNAHAANPDECAIWLCLPTGFSHPSCMPAKIAMYKRTLEFKSPVPSFSSCSVGGNPTGLDIVFGSAALLAQSGAGTDGSRVVVRKTCNFRDTGREEPLGCIDTLRTVQLIDNGLPMGDMHILSPSVTGGGWNYNPLTGVVTPVIREPPSE